MKIVRGRLTFLLLCLTVGLTVFGVSCTLLGQEPGDNVGEPPPGSTPNPTPGNPGDDDGQPGSVGQVNELFEVIRLGDVEKLTGLLQNGADPNQVDSHGHTALHVSVLLSDVSMG